MMLKKINYFLLVFIFVEFTNCALLQKIFMKKDPEFIIKSVSIQRVTLEGITLKVKSELYNYYSFGLPESILTYKVNLNKLQLFEGQTEKFSVKANSSVPIPLTVNLRYIDIANLIKEIQKFDKLQLSIDGKSVFPLNYPGLPKSISVPFNIEKTLPAFLPKIEIKNVNISLKNYEFSNFILGKSTLNLNLKLLVENTGGTLFALNQKNFVFQLQGTDILKTEIQKFPKSQKQEIEIATELPISSSMQALYKALMNKQLDYYLKSDLEFLFDNVDFTNIELPIEYKGKITTSTSK